MRLPYSRTINVLFLAVTGCLGHSHAAPITYDIIFATTGGSPAPTSGSFTYDSAAAIGSQFTDFNVAWDGFILDLTANANVGGGDENNNSCPTPNSATVFLFLTGTNECPGSPALFQWEGSADAGEDGFFYLQDYVPSTSSAIDVSAAAFNFNSSGPDFVEGTFVTTVASAPEPPSLLLLVGGIATMLLVMPGTSTMFKRCGV